MLKRLVFIALLVHSVANSVAASDVDERLLIEFDEYPQMIRDRDQHPRLRVFDNGRVEIYYPIYMKRAGHYALTLSQSELRQLLNNLDHNGMFHLSTLELADTVEQQRQIETPSGERFHISDDFTTRLAIRSTPTNEMNIVVWDNLRTDSRRYPNVAPLNNLASAVQQLRNLAQRTDLVRIDAPVSRGANQ